MSDACILFVDDDHGVLSSMRRMMHPMRAQWKMLFAPGGKEALEIMEKESVDVVVSDMRMPEMNGAQLLAKIKSRHPMAARIILSGHSERKMAIQAINVAHQYLNKPCAFEELGNVITKTILLRRMLGEPRLCELANGVVRMPSLPEHYMAITAELGSDEPSMERAAEIIQSDPAMTMTVLRLVNSGFFGLSSRINTVNEAIGMLGLELLRNLTLATGLFSKYESAKSFSIDKFTRRALAVGTLARKMAAQTGAPKVVIEESFIAGMLCDVGQLMLNTTLDEEYGRLLTQAAEERLCIATLEKENFGASHAEIGAYLMGLWGFADGITEAVAFHHHPQDSVTAISPQPLVFVHAADALVDKCIEGLGGDERLNQIFIAQVGLAEHLSVWREMSKSLTN